MIRFQTKGHADVVMFDAVAIKLVELMGHSGTVPGALNEDEVATALSKLQAAVSMPKAGDKGDWDSDGVSLVNRAQPLIELLTTAKNDQNHVIWDTSLL